MTDAERNPKWAADVRFRKVGGEVLVTAYGDVYALTDVSADIWSLADGTRSVAEIAAAITDRYDAPPERVLQDVQAFVHELAEAQLLVWVPARSSL
jgi:hypothetical protein